MNFFNGILEEVNLEQLVKYVVKWKEKKVYKLKKFIESCKFYNKCPKHINI